jgi:hypothetical protein
MPTTMRVELNRAALNRIASQSAGRLVLSTTRKVLNRAKILTPVDTGTLRNSQTMEVRHIGNKVVGRVSTRIKYALAVHEGILRPVIIVPKRKKALRFVINGRVVFARKVILPPRRGRPWLRRALIEVALPAGFVIVP